MAAPVPHDRPFYAIDAYGEVQHVKWIGEQGGPEGPYVGIIDSDGECFPVSDISDWDFDADVLAARVNSTGPYCCTQCTAGTWNDSDLCDACAERLNGLAEGRS